MPKDQTVQNASRKPETARETGQLPLDLAFRPALDREDFLISSCNSAAMSFIESWPEWPHYAALICGPEGSGKSHLANVWLRRSGAKIATSDEVNMASVDRLAGPPDLLIEDIDRSRVDEQALFHLLNLARTDKFHVLLTARTPPGEWQMRLPDLASRVLSAPMMTIGAPDDALLSAVLLKQFADRQLWVEPHVLSYISTRMERSMGQLRHLVEALDRAALASKRKVTRQLAADVLERHFIENQT